MTPLRRAAVPLLLVTLGCQTDGAASGDETDPGVGSGLAADSVVVVPERWISEGDTLWNVDTPALWHDQERGIVLVTGKDSHDLRMFDGAEGTVLGALGQEGTGLGDFLRPNAVLVLEDFVLVVERDNGRIQVLEMPEGNSLGAFGEGVLEYPYGIAMTGARDSLTLWVTDDYKGPQESVPEDLTRRLHRFTVRLESGAEPLVLNHETFGAAEGPGALEVVESIQVDPDAGTVFVADESRKAYLEHGSDGIFRGRMLGQGRIGGDPEGIVLVRCGASDGYWVVTDQQDDVSLFRIFDRQNLSYIATFRGAVTANTDGASFEPGPVPGFPNGAFYAIHDDQALSAFDWGEIVSLLDLRQGCGLR